MYVFLGLQCCGHFWAPTYACRMQGESKKSASQASSDDEEVAGPSDGPVVKKSKTTGELKTYGILKNTKEAGVAIQIREEFPKTSIRRWTIPGPKFPIPASLLSKLKYNHTASLRQSSIGDWFFPCSLEAEGSRKQNDEKKKKVNANESSEADNKKKSVKRAKGEDEEVAAKRKKAEQGSKKDDKDETPPKQDQSKQRKEKKKSELPEKEDKKVTGSKKTEDAEKEDKKTKASKKEKEGKKVKESREASGSVLADLLLEAADASDFRFFPPIRDIPHGIAQAIEGSLPHRTK